jgi:biopolymer transport protein ExbD
MFVVVTIGGIACFIIVWMFGGHSSVISLKRDATGKTVIYRGGYAVSEAELKGLLGRKKPGDSQPVKLRVDNDVPYLDVVKLTDLASGLGYEVSMQANRSSQPASPWP